LGDCAGLSKKCYGNVPAAAASQQSPKAEMAQGNSKSESNMEHHLKRLPDGKINDLRFTATPRGDGQLEFSQLDLNDASPCNWESRIAVKRVQLS
jgi:hypothetical protein